MRCVKGQVGIRIEREDGTSYECAGHNTLCAAALEKMSKFLVEGNSGSTGPISFLKIGSGVSYFTDKSQQIDLIREESSVDLYDKSYLKENINGKLIEAGDLKTNTVSYRFKIEMYDLTDNISVTELGLFTTDGTMFAYKVLDDPIEKRVNDRMFVDWVIVMYTVTGTSFTQQTLDYDEFWKMRKTATVDLKILKSTSKGPELRWTPLLSKGIAAYNIYRREYGSDTASLIKSIETEVGTHKSVYRIADTFIDSSIEWGKLYYYTVKVLNVSGVESDFSNEIVFPAIRLKYSVGKEKIQLFWDSIDDWSELAGYVIYQRNANDVYTIVGNIPESAEDSIKNYLTIKNLKGAALIDGQPYIFAVAAVDNQGNEYIRSFNIQAVPTEKFPKAPYFSHAEAHDGKADIVWQTVDDVVSYNLYKIDYGSQMSSISNMSNCSYSLLMPIDDFQAYSGTARLTVAGLENDHLYEMVLRSVNVDGNESVFSNAITTIPHIKVLLSPQGISIKESNKRLTVNWQPVEGAEKYQLYWYWRGEWLLLGETANNVYIAEGLNNGVTYMIKVAAFDYKDQKGKDSEVAFGTPSDTEAPSAVKNLQYSLEDIDILHKLIHTSWNANSDDDFSYYNVYGSGGSLGAFDVVTDITTNQFSVMLDVGEVYIFAITSVDKSGNEGAFSNQIRVVV